MKRFIYFTCALAFLSSCSEETIVSEIKGNIYLDCSYAALEGAEISLKANAGASFSEPLIIGGDIADRNGAFQFTYELEDNERGTGDLILTQSTGFITLLEQIELNRDFKFSLFYENTAHAFIDLSGTRVFGPADTLFMALEANNVVSYVVQPNPGRIDTLSASLSNRIDGRQLNTLYYGIGSADFALSKEAFGIADSTYNHLPVNLTGCLANDLVDLIIN